MPIKNDFGGLDYELEEIANAMPGSKVNSQDDGPTTILTNNTMEVAVEKIDPEDPECDRFTVVVCEAEEQTNIDQFVQKLSE